MSVTTSKSDTQDQATREWHFLLWHSLLAPTRVVDAIGAGGMGEVYRATDTKLGREVAIKTLPSTLATDTDRLARFEREAKLLATLNHPNIAVIYGLEEADGDTVHRHGADRRRDAGGEAQRRPLTVVDDA